MSPSDFLLAEQTKFGMSVGEKAWGQPNPLHVWFPVTDITAGNEIPYRKIYTHRSVAANILSAPWYASGTVTVDYFANSYGLLYPLAAIMGANAYVETNPSEYKVWEAAKGDSYTLYEYDGKYCRMYAGARPRNVDIKFDNTNGVTVEVVWASKMAQFVPVPSSSNMHVEPIPMFYNASVTINGTRSVVESGSIKIARQITVLHGRNLTDVTGLTPGPMTIDVDLVIPVEQEGPWIGVARGDTAQVTVQIGWFTFSVTNARYEKLEMDRSNGLAKMNLGLHAVWAVGPVKHTITTTVQKKQKKGKTYVMVTKQQKKRITVNEDDSFGEAVATIIMQPGVAR